MGNIVNRVFDSSGPEGKVRGTPQQIIDKYLTLARDAQLSNDRVAAENFLQHAEHYARMLSEAQREMEAQRQQNQQQTNDQPRGESDRDDQRRDDRNDRRDDRSDDNRNDRRDNNRGRKPQPVASDVIDVAGDDGPGLVETPEARGEGRPEAEPVQTADAPEPKAEEKPARARLPRKPKAATPADEAPEGDSASADQPTPDRPSEAAE